MSDPTSVPDLITRLKEWVQDTERSHAVDRGYESQQHLEDVESVVQMLEADSDTDSPDAPTAEWLEGALRRSGEELEVMRAERDVAVAERDNLLVIVGLDSNGLRQAVIESGERFNDVAQRAIDLAAERDAAVEEVQRHQVGESYAVGYEHGVATAAKFKAERDAAVARADTLAEVLHSVWLYIDWRYVTKQLTTEQKNLFADAVDAHSEEPPVADRWWEEKN